MAYTGNHAMGPASIIQRGGENMSRLIQMGGQMGAQMRDEKHQNREARKRYAAILKGYELDDEQIQAMSIGEMEGTVAQMETNRVREREQMQAQAAQQQMEMQRMQMEQMQQQQGAQQRYQELLRDGGTMQSNPNAPFTNEYAAGLQQMLQNPQMQHDVSMTRAAGGALPPDVMDRYRPEAAPWQPSVAPAEDFGGRPGDQVFMQSPNSAQLFRQGADDGRKLPPEEVLANAIRAARTEGDEELAQMLQQAWDKRMREQQLSPIEAFLLSRIGVDAPQPTTGRRSQAAPAAPPPVNQQTFFEGL